MPRSFICSTTTIKWGYRYSVIDIEKYCSTVPHILLSHSVLTLHSNATCNLPPFFTTIASSLTKQVLWPIYTKRKCQCSDNSVMMLAALHIENNGLQPQSGVTPLFSMRTVSLVSTQSYCSVDTDAQCNRALTILTSTVGQIAVGGSTNSRNWPKSHSGFTWEAHLLCNCKREDKP